MSGDGEFFRVTNANLGTGGVGLVELDGGAGRQMAIFYNKSVHNPRKSQDEGRPVFEDQVYVRIAPPGERLNIVDRPATRQDAQRWPVQWAQFQQNREQTPEGTPIDLMYPEKPAVAATLRANGVLTIEQCAELSGAAIDNIGMGAQQWSNFAKDYVAKANKGVAIVQHRKDLEERDREIKILKQQVSQLSTELEKMRAAGMGNAQVEKFQEMIAAAMGRPVQPGSRVGGFDMATSQINAIHSERNNPKPKRVRIKP